ncbi:hypothetical protein [Sebaldella sp. S0638]|uniref:hypothetical protein n=1 Tax=Sebaldella sp. S0638 TaxID=2957809 RepID=UPI0020A04C4E|nr:hypothetical protein [Sebaldella sp. S0638]MCP1223044.1 hypothetical protein [Sebaldella sp. S0638]
MSDGEVRGRLKVERNFQINKIKSFRIRKSPKEENLPFERESLLINRQVKIISNPFYFGLPQLNIAAIPALLPSLLFFTNTARRGRIRRKFMAL